MKRIIPFLLLGALHASAQTASYVNFIRQNQQGAGVVWDMPVEAVGAAPSALTLENGGALFQLWTIEQTAAKDYLLDQKLVGAYLPTADIKVITLDPDGDVPRTRVDQPFTVEINIAGLLTGLDMPQAASKVLLERHLGSYEVDQTALDPAVAVSGSPFSSAYLSENGKTVLRFSASSLTAEDPTKASGEEHFVVHALSDGNIEQSQIASGFVKVCPVASGSIKGIADGDQLRFQAPKIELLLNDLYPRSDTYLLLFEGTQITGVEGEIVKPFPVDGESCVSTVIGVTELESKLGADGTYTLALVSDTVYGRELLCEPVTFSVNRTLQVNAMQVNMTDGQDP
jgi:hypothetical protein